jgi:cell division transport system permease protein
MTLVAKAASFWRSAMAGMRHSPFVHLVAVLTIAIALFTAGLARCGVQILESLLSSLGGEVEMTVYLPEDASAEDAEALAKSLGARTGGSARVVPKDEALERLARALGDLGNVLHDLPENPLPLSLEVRLPPEKRAPAVIRAIASEIRSSPQVAGVDYGEKAVERLSSIATAARYGGLLALVIVAVATVIIVSATLQLAIYARREEIEIQKLVGATDRFVKAPFLIEGLFQGLLGAGLACLGLVSFAALAAPRLVALFAFVIGPGGMPDLLTPVLFAELAAIGAGLGLLGSFVAVGRFLRV